MNSFIFYFYSISVISEMLLYFIFGSGLLDKLSRQIQFSFLLFFSFYLLFNTKNIMIDIKFKKIHIYFLLFLIVGLISTFFNLISGTYYEGLLNYLKHLETYSVNFSYLNTDSMFKSVFNLPIIEILKYLYFYFYFAILLPFIIDTNEKLIKFVDLFYYIFIFCLLVGFIVLIDVALKDYGEQVLISRHWYYDDQMNVGVRFMGIFGEPRDSAVALLLGALLLYIRSDLRNLKPPLFVFSLILIALFFTISGSLMISMLIYPLIFILFYPQVLANLNIQNISIFLITSIFAFVIIYSGERTFEYFIGIQTFITQLSRGEMLEGLLATQVINIYPIYLFLMDLFSLNFLDSFIGHGISSSNIIKVPHETFSLNGPHSLLTRLLYEFGIIGTFIWIQVFALSLHLLKKNMNNQKWYVILIIMTALLSIAIVHKSSLIYIALGVILTLATYHESTPKFRR